MKTPSVDNYVMPRWLRPWEQFWFAPADPTVLAMIRISCGMIVVYTLLVYSFRLQEFMGEHGWHDLQTLRATLEERPVVFGPLDWSDAGPLPEPRGEFQINYLKEYRQRWGFPPLPPYPTSPEQALYLDAFREEFKVDLRINGLRPPTIEGGKINGNEKLYAEDYTRMMGTPPPAYPKTNEEAQAIIDYINRWRTDPRRLYAKGTPIFSLWIHVTDPTAMAVLHGLIVLIAVLFTIGFCTRITSALIWFGSLCYIHRNPTVLFGVDTMMTILLLYLMIGPSGAAYSVDRLIRKWWVKAKPGIVQWWYGLLRLPLPSDIAPAEPVPDAAAPSTSANVAIRLVQIHVCIIYLFSGLSKLQGSAWWNGEAIWLAMGNYEFAPMQFELYLKFVRFLGTNRLLYDAFMSGGGLFTLAFEIGYAFLIWRPRLRWVFLGSALLLHGGIGLFLGLKTFSLMMLVMNMAFLRKEEVVWLLSLPLKLLGSPAREPTVQAAATPAK